MLVELRDVEVFIEPQDILTQALEEGDLQIDRVVQDCITEEGAESVLDAVDNNDITNYVEKYDLNIEIDEYDQVVRAIKEFSQAQKAQLLWQLLKCEG